jgi:hypothetical protein
MINQYPAWKYLLLLFILVVGLIYALPNLYGADPALQISGSRTNVVDQAVADRISAALKVADIPVKSVETRCLFTGPTIRVEKIAPFVQPDWMTALAIVSVNARSVPPSVRTAAGTPDVYVGSPPSVV